MTNRVRAPWRWAVTALIPMLLIATAIASAAPGSAVRQCVQLNLPKYSNPGSAVVAQYSDIETTCRAALDDGSVSVRFDSGEPSSDTSGGSSGGSGGSGASDGDVSSGGGTSAPTASAPRPATTQAPAKPGRRTDRTGTTTPAPAADTSARVVAQAIAQAGTGVGSPLPSSLSEGSTWRYVLVGGAVLLVLVAGGLALRRRLS